MNFIFIINIKLIKNLNFSLIFKVYIKGLRGRVN